MKFKNCVLMMGMFHLLMMYMSILSKRFADAGLRDALIQSSIVAEGSVDTALRGKQYNGGVRLYKIFYEVLIRMLIPNITYDSVSTEDDSPKWSNYEISTHDIHVKMKDDEDFNKLHHEFLNLKVNWSDAQNKTLRTFWLSYIDMTELLLNTICRSFRKLAPSGMHTRNPPLHLRI